MEMLWYVFRLAGIRLVPIRAILLIIGTFLFVKLSLIFFSLSFLIFFTLPFTLFRRLIFTFLFGIVQSWSSLLWALTANTRARLFILGKSNEEYVWIEFRRISRFWLGPRSWVDQNKLSLEIDHMKFSTNILLKQNLTKTFCLVWGSKQAPILIVVAIQSRETDLWECKLPTSFITQLEEYKWVRF